LDTGLKRRFFLTIGFVLAIAIGAVGVLQYLLFRAEQFHLIDHQIESTASLLISSALTTVELKEIDEAEEIVEKVIGGEKLNQFVVIISRKGQVIYRSSNAEFLPPSIPFDEKWQTIENDGHFIRVLSVPLESHKLAGKQHRMLQTGIILDEDLIRWKSVGRHVLIYSILIVILIFLTTMILSQSLLLPLNHLAQYLKFMASQFDEKQMVTGEASMGAAGTLAVDLMSGHDEFGELVQAAQSLHNRIRQSLKTTQAWTAQMAHELKTPLTILRNCLEAASSASSEEVRAHEMREAISEVAHLNTLINSFLEWTAAENFPLNNSEVHAIKLKATVEETTEKISRQWHDRVKLQAESDLTVFARPGFVQQAISNLILNALKYSPLNSTVEVTLKGGVLTVTDQGPGIPEAVLQSLGQPFNYGHREAHGFGLGLAWVTTICKRYDWQLSFERGPNGVGTIAKIEFPKS
jgi:signal transduction histidine kinase